MKKSFTCSHGHQWEVALDVPFAAVACMSCPECGAAAETLTPADSSVERKSRAESRRRHEEPTFVPRKDLSTSGAPKELVDHPRYQVVEAIGAGGMGAVFKAEHRLMERQVALKVIRPGLLEQPGAVERFHREVKVAARLSHPNIVMAFDAEQAGDLNFLVMEYVEGVTLARLVETEGPLPASVACAYLVQALHGLEHASARGMVHRDLKPHNLMRTPDGVVKILDFGLARFVRESSPAGAQTHTGMVMGTADYIAPEQATRPHQADVRADLYSLGCTLYFLLTGQPPFASGSVVEKLLWHQQKAPLAVERLRPDLPPGLPAVLGKLMAKRPQDRYQNPTEAAKALAPFTDPVRPAPPARRRWHWLVGAAALLLLGFVVVRVATDNGELEIKTADDDVQIAVLKGGQEIAILDLKSKHKVRLRSGRYELRLVGEAGDLMLSTDRFDLKRGEKTIVEVRRVGDPPPDKGQVPQGPDVIPKGVVLVPLTATIPLKGGHNGAVRCVTISRDGKQAASGGGHWERNSKIAPSENKVCVWDLKTLKVTAHHKEYTKYLITVLFSPDGERVISIGADKNLLNWHVKSNTFVRATTAGVPGKMDLFSDRLLTAPGRGAPVLWKFPSLKLEKELEGPKDDCYTVAYSSKGNLAVSAGGRLTKSHQLAPSFADYRLWLWDLKTGEAKHLKGHTRTVWSVAFLPDDQHILSAGADMTIRLWNIAQGREIRQFKGHTGAVNMVAVSTDGKFVLSGGNDLTARLWDIRDLHNPKELYRLVDHVGRVIGLAFSPDGRQALIAGDTGLRLWNIPESPPARRDLP